MAHEEKEKESVEQPIEKWEGERVETIGTERMEMEEDIPRSPLFASFPRGAIKVRYPRFLVKKNISPLILIFIGIVTGIIVNIVTREPMSNGRQIGQIEELVVNTVTQESMSTKGQVEETVLNAVFIEALEENVTIGINPQGPKPVFKQMEEDDRETKKSHEKGVENATP